LTPFPHISYLIEINSMRSFCWTPICVLVVPGFGSSACHEFFVDVVRRRFPCPSVPVRLCGYSIRIDSTALEEATGATNAFISKQVGEDRPQDHSQTFCARPSAPPSPRSLRVRTARNLLSELHSWKGHLLAQQNRKYSARLQVSLYFMAARSSRS